MRLARAGMLALCLLAGLAGCGETSHKLKVMRVASPNMSPTYHQGELVTVDLDAYKTARPKRGDVVLFHPPRGSDPSVDRCGTPSQPTNGHPCDRPLGGPLYPLVFIERVSATGGDWIAIRRNRVYLGRSAKGPFRLQVGRRVAACLSPLCNLPKPARVPEGSYFMTGDNRDESNDSRKWGPVPFEWIDGKVGR